MDEKVYIEDVHTLARRIHAKFVYRLSYDKEKREFLCDCPAFYFRRTCRHIESFKEYLGKEGVI